MSNGNLKERLSQNWIPAVCFIACVALAVVAVVLVYQCNACSPSLRLTLLVGYGTLILVFFFGLMVLMEMAMGRIDLTQLLSESGPGGKTCAASLSRFQLLIFTFVIALSLFLVTVANNKFPDHLPPEILTLLGISASTYAVSKGIQASSPSQQAPTDEVTTSTTNDPATGKTTTMQHSPSTGRTSITVHDPAAGQTTTTIHHPTTVTTTTSVSPLPPTIT